MLNSKFLALIKDNPKILHFRTRLPFTLEAAYQFSTSFRPKVEYSFLQGIFGTTVIDRGKKGYLKVLPPRRGTTDIHYHPGKNKTDSIPSAYDQITIWEQQTFGGILSFRGLTIYRGSDYQFLCFDKKNEQIIKKFLKSSVFEKFRDYDLLEKAADRLDERSNYKKRHVLIKWKEMMRFYKPETNIFEIVKEKSREIFPKYLF